MGGASVLQDERSLGDWIQDNINVLNITDPNCHYNKFFVICVLSQFKKNEKKNPILSSIDIKIIGN